MHQKSTTHPLPRLLLRETPRHNLLSQSALPFRVACLIYLAHKSAQRFSPLSASRHRFLPNISATKWTNFLQGTALFHLPIVVSILLISFGSMYQALRSTNATASGATLPKTLPISVNDTSAILPTHMAAVYSSAPSAPEPRRVTMYPVHQSILSLYCANLPVLPPSTPCPATPSSPFQVPVVPLALPHPESFPLLTQFLYLKDKQPLFQTFLGLIPVNEPGEDLDRTVTKYSTILAQNYTTQRLASQAAKLHGFWRNAYALGIFDVDLQVFFDLAWAVLMAALILSSSRAPTTAVVSA